MYIGGGLLAHSDHHHPDPDLLGTGPAPRARRQGARRASPSVDPTLEEAAQRRLVCGVAQYEDLVLRVEDV